MAFPPIDPWRAGGTPPTPTPDPNNPFAGMSNWYPSSSQPNNYYQMQQGDTFESVANQYGYSVPEIQQTNGMVVPPPKGSYIDLPQQRGTYRTGSNIAPNLSTFYSSERNPGSYYGNGVVPTPPPTGVSSLPGRGNYQGSGVDLVTNITRSFQSGVNPTIPNYVLGQIKNPVTGQALTPQDLLNDGYKLNEKTGQWTPPTAPNANATPGKPTKSETGQWTDVFGNTFDSSTAQTDVYGERFVRPGTKKFVKGVGFVVATKGGWKKRRILSSRNDKEIVAPVVEKASNAGTTASQQLNTSQASG